jgi:nucleotide-binding universal stress UspA family protein
MYSKILVPLDGSALAERAVNHSVEIARGTGAEIILLRVVQGPLSMVPEAGLSEELKSVQEVATHAAAYLSVIASRLSKEGVKVRTQVLEGAADGAILGFAHDENVDILVMSTHGRTGLSKALMGSVAEKVMLTTKRPVLLVKPERIHKETIDEVDVFLSAH